MRPTAKEFDFEPQTLEVEISEGQDEEAAFSAKKVAFAVTGTVTSIRGTPSGNVPVQAVPQTPTSGVKPNA